MLPEAEQIPRYRLANIKIVTVGAAHNKVRVSRLDIRLKGAAGVADEGQQFFATAFFIGIGPQPGNQFVGGYGPPAACVSSAPVG